MPENHRTIAIIQGRMSSSRLPGKVMLDLAGEPMLLRVVERVRLAKTLDGLVVATTLDSSDDALETFCRQNEIDCYRGSLPDVLDRFYQAARIYRADIIVRITADCPLVDPGLIDETVTIFNEQGADFAANRLPPPFHRTYPIGLDVEVCSFAALEQAWKEATALHDREHVLPYLYEVTGRFKVAVLNHSQDFGSLRWTVDTAQDLELVRQIYGRLAGKPDFTWLDVLAIFEREPALAEINAGVAHKTMFEVDARYKK